MLQTAFKKSNPFHEPENLEYRYEKLLKENTTVRDGILYASTIQNGLLPKTRHFNRMCAEHFIIYRPLNTIGGDFYWVGSKDGKKIFATADCTGHGIPGAMLTVLGISFLNYVVLGKEWNSAGEILKEIDKKWIETFDPHSDGEGNNDWMEISVCVYDTLSRKLSFAGANGNLFAADCNGPRFYEGNSYPVGGWQLEKNRRYDTTDISLELNTRIYMGSDGFRHQFGGDSSSHPRGKKFSRKRLFNLLADVYNLPMYMQKLLIENQLDAWKGSFEQTDDICIMGIRL
ncbi:MAG: PP2C family protein-serine/threonine phosphatase [Bacteroidota bacterium]